MFKNVYTTRMSGTSKTLKRRFEKINNKSIKFKKIAVLACTMFLILVFILSTIVMAKLVEEQSGEYQLDIMNNGKIIEFENKPFVENGEVYVPLSEIFTKVGLMESDYAKIELNDGVVLITLCQKTLNADAHSAYESYSYKIEIGKSELIINPNEIFLSSVRSYEFTEPMSAAPMLKDDVIYIPFEYALRIIERADLGILSPPERYDLEILYSGETFSIAYPIEDYYTISRTFGEKLNLATGEKIFHNGIDFKAEEGAPVKAGIDGSFKVFFDREKGACITIYGENNVEVTYCHLNSDILDKQWSVKTLNRGAVIGNVGNTGMSTGAHLHMEVKINGKNVNPKLYLEESLYDKLVASVTRSVEDVLKNNGYVNADYKIVGIKHNMEASLMPKAIVKVHLYNYDNKTVSILYSYYGTPSRWMGGIVLPDGTLPEVENIFIQ